ncbi:MAG: glycoside hydrolase family 3 C-terminal domain-containing protein [Spirochaetales bacterium]|nr:glycoside hydrolase family 3 C-terminal domain-containing protein [Spirochaetales bacterium]
MDIEQILEKMTLEEKVGLCSGGDFWKTKAFNRLGIPRIMLSDGPHGLRKQREGGDHVGINDSIRAVCFPTGVTVASSFDRQLIQKLGELLGESCQAENVAVILGPAVNIKRSPLCGRNFEYFSEDPYLSSEMAVAQIKGIQSRGVGASIKHYLANSQEHRRMTSDSRVDERTLREIYLPTFERAVKEAQPWTVMCSYNRINGTHASEHRRFLTDILRDEWGFDGVVLSDWGAVNDRVKGLAAGLDLEMPSSYGLNDSEILEAVRRGELSEEVLNRAVRRILRLVNRHWENRGDEFCFNLENQHNVAREIAGESMVLLKNDGILPLKKKGKIAFIGAFALTPRFQGGGSSHINAFKESNCLDVAGRLLGEEAEVVYAPGYLLSEDKVDQTLLGEAAALGGEADRAVIFAGLPDSYESEGYDRKHMKLPYSHTRLIEEVCRVQPNTIIVLHNGSPVEMPWIDNVKAVLEAYLGGQAVGEAVMDILFGDVNPSGKLAETFPLRCEDNPSFLNFPGEKDVVEYREGLFVGYRYYDKKMMNVLFPFGHGLSYTDFSYSNIKSDLEEITDKDRLTVSVDITNRGCSYGKEVVQLYMEPPQSDFSRPIIELKGFEKIGLEPGETGKVSFTLDKRSFAYFNCEIDDWHVESGDYVLLVGSSSRDIRLKKRIRIKSTVKIPKLYDMNTLVGDLLREPDKAGLIKDFLKAMEQVFSSTSEGDSASDEAVTEDMKRAMFDNMPLRNFISFGGGKVDRKSLEELIDTLNGK